MGDIVLSPAMFTAVNTLANIRTQMEAAQTRLATGNRVNSPLDDPNAVQPTAHVAEQGAPTPGLMSAADAAYSR